MKVLPGIGDAYAKKIIDRLSLQDENGHEGEDIPVATYDKIAGKIIAKQK